MRSRARIDGLRLLRAINGAQAHGQQGTRTEPARAANKAGLGVGSERYREAMAYLIEEAALLGSNTELGADRPLVQRGVHLGVATHDGLPDRPVEPPISGVASSRVKSSHYNHRVASILKPTSAPLVDVIQDIYPNDTHRGRGYSYILLSLASV